IFLNRDGPYTFHTTRAFSVRGRPAGLDVLARMDTRSAPHGNPPLLESMQVFADGEAADSIALTSVRDAGVRFSVVDPVTGGGDPACVAALFVRAVDAPSWTPLALRRDGRDWVASLPPLPDGPVALKLEATDPWSNALTLTWDPAFLVTSVRGAAFAALQAD